MGTLVKFTRWKEEERIQLAFIIQKGIKKKSTVHDACLYAAKKLNRTPAGCEYQWHKVIKDNLETYLKPVEQRKDWDFETAEPMQTWTAEKAERIVEAPKAKVKLPTIEVHSTMNSEVAEIIAQSDDTIIARASRGIIIVIKNDH